MEEKIAPLFQEKNPTPMDQLVQTRAYTLPSSTMDDAVEMILGQLQSEMDKTSFETWVKPLKPVSYRDGVFTVGARNTYGRDWVEARLRSRVTHMLEGMLTAPVRLKFTVVNEFFHEEDGEPAPRKEKPSVQPSDDEPSKPVDGNPGGNGLRENPLNARSFWPGRMAASAPGYPTRTRLFLNTVFL
jgi:hypothetical protein